MAKIMCRASIFVLFLSFIWASSISLFARPEESATFDSRLFQEMRWRNIGPFRGGRSLAVTGVRGQPNLFYFGAVDGGVWRTDDAGRTWNPIFDSESIASIGAIAVAPSDPNIIYVGTGEADMRSNIAYGDGMYKSMDAGKTWSHIGLIKSRQIARILVDPHDANKLFVAVLGHAYGPNQERGVYHSEDGGKTWQRILFHDENTGAIDIAFEPGNPETIYATLWQTRRPPWHIYPPSNGPGTGLYRSKDGGAHWEHLTEHGLPSEGLGRMGIAIAPSNTRRIYLMVDAKAGGLYRSDDSGENWQRVSDDARIWNRGWYFGEVSVDPKNEDMVYVPAVSVYASQDGGRNFTAFKGSPGGDDYHTLWIDPDDSRRIALSSDQGTIISLNRGATWSSWFNQPTGQFYHVVTDNRFPYWVYGAQQDSGAAGTASRGDFRAINFTDWRPVNAGDENGFMAVDPLDPQIIYGGFVTREDLRTEQDRQIPPGMAQQTPSRRNWTSPLIFSPSDPHVLYYGAQFLFRTTDNGNSWLAVSPDLSREDPGATSNLDATTIADAPKEKRRGAIYTIAPSPLQRGEIWIGTDDGLIQLTRDEGKTWSNITPSQLSPWSKVTHIEASHFDAGTAYAAIDRHRLDDLQPYLYRTRDFGKTWQLAVRGIPNGFFLNCVREDPVRKGLLYACTERGVFVSFNDGENWQPLQLNLPVTSVRDLVIHGNDAVIATHGRSFWILDDVTPLRQMTAQVAASGAWLFHPANAYRVRAGSNQGGLTILVSDQGTPIPLDEPFGDNPPDGAVLDYYLKEKPSSPVQLEIRDANGKLFRRFASDDTPWKIDPQKTNFTTSWIHDAKPLSAEPGMHRFVWNLHAALPPSIHRTAEGPFEIWAPTGNYSVTLIVGGERLSQPLVVELDPRVHKAPADLVQEFRSATRVAARLEEISVALDQSEELERQIAEYIKNGSGAARDKTTITDLDQKLRTLTGKEDVAEAFPLFRLSLPGTSPTTLHETATSLTDLLQIVDMGDAAPTADALTAINQWDSAARNVLTRWNAAIVTLPSPLHLAGK